jgi:tRNA threonylcarbamoyl adenosine modification protein (Sua5/YciO/YrdC/YwlC family)
VIALADPHLATLVGAELAADHCVVLPTDTVYGLAAQVNSRPAVERLQAIKGRGSQFPPPVLIADEADLLTLVTDLPAAAQRLADRFWPGALTLVLPRRPDRALGLGAVPSLAIRLPDHSALRALLRQTGPLACSSANRHGQPAATTVAAAQAQLGDQVACYVDGGPTPGPTPSTIVSFLGPPQVLRVGRIDSAAISRELSR